MRRPPLSTTHWCIFFSEDVAENRRAVERCFRILSSYQLSTDVRLWVITEADRSVTTLLLPEEY